MGDDAAQSGDRDHAEPEHHHLAEDAPDPVGPEALDGEDADQDGDRHRHHEIAEALAQAQLVGEHADAGCDIAAIPSFAGENRKQRLALERGTRSVEQPRQAGRHLDQALGGIGAPQPVGAGVLELAQQQADQLFLAGQCRLGGNPVDEEPRVGDEGGGNGKREQDHHAGEHRTAVDRTVGRGGGADDDDEGKPAEGSGQHQHRSLRRQRAAQRQQSESVDGVRGTGEQRHGDRPADAQHDAPEHVHIPPQRLRRRRAPHAEQDQRFRAEKGERPGEQRLPSEDGGAKCDDHDRARQMCAQPQRPAVAHRGGARFGDRGIGLAAALPEAERIGPGGIYPLRQGRRQAGHARED